MGGVGGYFLNTTNYNFKFLKYKKEMKNLILDINTKIVFEKKWNAEPIPHVVQQSTLGDFNADGLTDIAINFMDIKADTNDLHILLAQKDGSFIDGNYLISNLVPTYQTSNILSADLNRDGFTDLIIGRSGGDTDTLGPGRIEGDTQLIYLSNGIGGYKALQSTTKPYIHNVMIGDVNSDGLVDAFFLATGIGPSLLAINQTDTASDFLFTTNGLPDKAINSSTPDGWEVSDRHPSGWIKTAKGFHQHNTAFNDVNRDGKLDMVMFFAGSREGLIYPNTGADIPDFSEAKPLEFNSVITGIPSAGNYYYFEYLDGFIDPVLRHVKQGTNYYETIQFDINGDGWEDIVAVAAYDNQEYQSINGEQVFKPGTDQFIHGTLYQTLINNGSGLSDETDNRIIQPSVNFKTDYHYAHITMLSMVDLNGDGFMDFTSQQNSGMNYGKPNWNGEPDTIFMLNDGFGKFKPITIAGMEYGSFDPVPIQGKLGFVANILPTDNQWDLPGFPSRPYWETKFIQTNVPWTIGDEKNNHVYGTAANDLIDGGAGIDTYHAMGRSQQFSYEILRDSVKLVDLSGLEGIDTLSNVERIKFYETNIALDIGPSQNAGSVYMLYKAAFNRAPDDGGMGYWIAQKDGGANIVNSIAQGFVNSAEFVGKYGTNPTNASYVNNLYQNVLGRAGEAGGVAYWTGEMDAGRVSKAQALVQFATLPEGAGIVAPLIANGIQYQEWLG